MTPLFLGRIQTRIFVSLIVGGIWTLLITPFLPLSTPDGYEIAFTVDGGLGDVYKLTFAALLITTFFGCIFWEPIYHGLMQFRWEKDWPALFHLLQVFPEGLTTFVLLHVSFLNPLPELPGGGEYVPVLAYLILFSTTWIVTWLFANGPMKIFFLRWRFRGGQII